MLRLLSAKQIKKEKDQEVERRLRYLQQLDAAIQAKEKQLAQLKSELRDH